MYLGVTILHVHVLYSERVRGKAVEEQQTKFQKSLPLTYIVSKASDYFVIIELKNNHYVGEHGFCTCILQTIWSKQCYLARWHR